MVSLQSFKYLWYSIWDSILIYMPQEDLVLGFPLQGPRVLSVKHCVVFEMFQYDDVYTRFPTFAGVSRLESAC
jgi:hypothetical protein